MGTPVFAVVVEFQVKPEHVDAFGVAMAKQAQNSLELEEACRQFDVFTDPLKPATFVLYELYDDEAAFEAHLASDHFASFAAHVEPMVLERDIRRLHRA